MSNYDVFDVINVRDYYPQQAIDEMLSIYKAVLENSTSKPHKRFRNCNASYTGWYDDYWIDMPEPVKVNVFRSYNTNVCLAYLTTDANGNTVLNIVTWTGYSRTTSRQVTWWKNELRQWARKNDIGIIRYLDYPADWDN